MVLRTTRLNWLAAKESKSGSKYPQQIATKIDKDRNLRTDLDNGGKRRPWITARWKKLAKESDVSARRDRQEFSEALHDAKEDRF